ncbi:2662_t:CDS:2 [Acaulospora morrowiae]|uniref:2662_t:CDS:1 n=1 Tax=Acaulospora morrowiae TaxID=94023 RepID=A0A9N9BRT1_9GLOM|nr:2662_t:CDS:2 [Acaulospora morrowiae]
MKYVATASDEDNSIFGWSIVLEHSGQYRFDFDYLIDLKESKFDHSTAPEEFKSNHSTDSEESDHPTISKGLDNSRIKCILSGVSDCKHISLMTNVDIPYNFEIFDITSGSWKMLNVQGLTGIIDRISFLENGDMAIIKGSPVYRAYIFSKPSSNNKHEWKCTSCIELSEYNKCVISQKGKLLILSDIPFVIMQWNLKTLELETQYVLDLNFSVDVDIDQIQMELNGDSTLLALLSPDSDTLVSSNPDSFDKLIVISDYIIRDNDVCLQIQRWNDILLHEHDESGDNLENELGDDLGGYNKIDVYSCGKEIRRIVQSTLEKYKIVKDIPLHDLPKKYSGKLYTWTVEHSSNYVTLKVYENEMEIGEIEVWKHKIKVGEVKEFSVNELKKYVKKVKSDYDDSSRPYLSPAILKISEYDKDIEEKIDDLYKKMEESDKRFDKVINLLESITQKKNEVEDE